MEIEVTMGHWAATRLSAFPTLSSRSPMAPRTGWGQLSLWPDEETVACRVEVTCWSVVEPELEP